ncbi:MAG: bifunctional acetate--CoA ligase family protein/GNAT family N-acetyltransferase [Acidobacteria bacterium]|nr:bifunctional acetate--CoA ligase family protein/GNAT family N-acetyltransferase [Acidobacteriota bacterium]
MSIPKRDRKPESNPAQTKSKKIRGEGHPLDAIFNPHGVAVIGATDREGSVGRAILWSLLSSPFGGAVYPVSERRSNVLGIKAYPTVQEIPEQVDLAVIATPAETVPAVIAQCVAAGVKGAIVISAGFKEHGDHGKELERQILAQLGDSGMRVIGPNCLGIMNPITGLNATFASHHLARPGNVAFISQSGALCTAILDWAKQELVGFSAFVSVGSMLDVGWGDLIDYLGSDPRTHSIVMYMESVGDARSFLSAAREVSLTKPIIVIKAGRTEAAAHAAASHTGTLAGSDEVLDAAFLRCGVLRVNTIADLFYMAEVLSKQPRPKGPRLAVVTNAGGPGVLAADSIIAAGGELAQLSPETMDQLNQLLPSHWSHNNPVDILGDALPDKYAKVIEIVANDPSNDGVLAITCPQGMSHPTVTAEKLVPFATGLGKPVLATWMGGGEMTDGMAILNRAGIPTFSYPDTAARIFYYMWRYSYLLRGLYETPLLPQGAEGPDRTRAEALIETVRQTGRTLLTEPESKELLACYGIPTAPTLEAHSEDEAAAQAEKLGYPVVLKLLSHTITHKTDVGGVKLNLSGAAAVKRAWREIESSVREKAGADSFQGVTVQPFIRADGYELILGSSVDAQFGPVLLFGTGGQLVEVFKDRALSLPPLNTTLARRVMEQTKIFAALQGVRGRKAIDMGALEDLLVRFSQLVVEQRWIREIDINPLLASPERLIALDARVIVYPQDAKEEQLPRLAIRPYPKQYVRAGTMKNGKEILFRPIRPEDEPLLIKLHHALSDRTVYMRYFQSLKLSQRTAHERLTRICFIDYDREMALVAEQKNAEGDPEIIAIGRLSQFRGRHEAEMAVLVDDRFQHQGLGTELFCRLIEVARAEKLVSVESTILAENRDMQAICRKLGFRLKADIKDGTVQAVLTLSDFVPAESSPANN